MGTYAQQAALTQIVGKTITGVVMTEGTAFPKSQLFLTFSDNTYYELYCVYDEIVGTNHLSDGGIDDVKACTTDRHIAHEVVDTISVLPSCRPDTVEDTLSVGRSIRPRPDLLVPRGLMLPPRLSEPGDAAHLHTGPFGPLPAPTADVQRAARVQDSTVDDWPLPTSLDALLQLASTTEDSTPATSPFAEAGKVIHDVNNALTTIIGYLDLLSATLPPSLPAQHKAHDYLNLIGVASEDAATLIRRYYDATRGDENGRTVASVRVNDVIEQVVALTRPKWQDRARAGGRTIQIVTELGEVPPIVGDATGLRTVLTNLIHNAADAVDGAGTITIRSWRDDDDLVLQVSDTGAGMREDVRLRAADPYFTTKERRGTGLGLAIVSEIVGHHGGTVEISSAPGAGTTVTLHFPLAT